jgi:hypothetical protein
MQEPLSTRVPGEAHIDRVLEEMHREFQSLMLQRAAILRRIGTIKQIIVGLANLLGDDVVGEGLLELVGQRSSTRPRGFTRTCRLILMESKRPLMSQEVCQEIERRNPILLSNHKDPMASVSTVLNRLATYGEARVVVNDRGRRAWEWATDHSAVTLSPPNEHEIQDSRTFEL